MKWWTKWQWMVLLPDHKKYVSLGPGCCLLYLRGVLLEDSVHKMLHKEEEAGVTSRWHKLLGWDVKDGAKWSMGTSMAAMKHYDECTLNCLTRYCMGAMALAQQVFYGHKTTGGSGHPTDRTLAKWYRQGMCQWCTVHCSVDAKEDRFHFLVTCLAYKVIRVDTIWGVSKLYRGATGHKLQWAQWMGVDPVHLWLGFVPLAWHNMVCRKLCGRDAEMHMDKWEQGMLSGHQMSKNQEWRAQQRSEQGCVLSKQQVASE
jgi:hypothetical protein